MGIPAFFKQIINKYPKTHAAKIEDKVDYFFIDFNSMIYDVHNNIDKSVLMITNTQYENFLISEVVKKLAELVKIVQPQKLLYIAMDGPAPRAKMVQQRSRRYKSIMRKSYVDELQNVVGAKKSPITWDTVAISPGTKFMKKLSTAIKNKSLNYRNNKDMKTVFSDSNVPGEGEHKFLHIIRDLSKNKMKDNIVIFSPDADMIVLSMATMKDNIYIMRKVRTGSDATDIEKNYTLAGHQYLFLSIDKYTNSYLETLNIDVGKFNKQRIITDFVFLTFMGGNDFVMPIPYLEVKEEELRQTRNTAVNEVVEKDTKSEEKNDGKTEVNENIFKKRGGRNARGGINILLNIYEKILTEDEKYLIDIKNGKYLVNILFFKRLIEQIVKSEDFYMRGFQMKIDKVRSGETDPRKLEREADKTPYEIAMVRYEHYEFASKLHPFYKQYKELYDKFNFARPKSEWKPIYYSHFFHINPMDMNEYNSYRTQICINYLESLVFTLRYYFEGVPSWTWSYRYRAPPMLSDVLINLNKYFKDMNMVKFELGKPFHPFDQLMMILPVQYGNLLPKNYHSLMKNELLEYYPVGFELDVLFGKKWIYSNPILPYIDEKKLLETTNKLSLNKEETDRNELKSEPLVK